MCGLRVCSSGKPLKELMGIEMIFLLLFGAQQLTVLPTIHSIPLLFKENKPLFRNKVIVKEFTPPSRLCLHIDFGVCVSLQSCLTLCNPVDCSLPGSSVCGIFQARIREWVAMPSSRGSSQTRDGTCVSCGSNSSLIQMLFLELNLNLSIQSVSFPYLKVFCGEILP